MRAFLAVSEYGSFVQAFHRTQPQVTMQAGRAAIGQPRRSFLTGEAVGMVYTPLSKMVWCPDQNPGGTPTSYSNEYRAKIIGMFRNMPIIFLRRSPSLMRNRNRVRLKWNYAVPMFLPILNRPESCSA